MNESEILFFISQADSSSSSTFRNIRFLWPKRKSFEEEDSPSLSLLLRGLCQGKAEKAFDLSIIAVLEEPEQRHA